MKRLYSFIFLFALTAFARGDDFFPNATLWKPCATYNNPSVGTAINDIEQHYKPLSYMQPASTYRDGDLVTWAHELTHAVNSLIRNTFGNSDTHQSVYLLHDVAYVFRTPKCNLYDVRQRVTTQGYSYDLYFVRQMSDWHHQPLYPLDELQAYTNGTVAGLEKYGATSRVKFSLERAEEFNGYAHDILRTVKELDPGYADLAKLESYVTKNTEILSALRQKVSQAAAASQQGRT